MSPSYVNTKCVKCTQSQSCFWSSIISPCCQNFCQNQLFIFSKHLSTNQFTIQNIPKMGAPELPGDLGRDENVNPIQANVHHPPVASDDSDYELNTGDAYAGYQPLYMSADEFNDHPATIDDDDTHEENDNMDSIAEGVASTNTNGMAENLPNVVSADAEIERLVWSEPRPKELQLELDNTKTTQILNVMANITLPNAVVPDWAAGVPEEHWKEELLTRIRRREESAATTNK